MENELTKILSEAGHKAVIVMGDFNSAELLADLPLVVKQCESLPYGTPEHIDKCFIGYMNASLTPSHGVVTRFCSLNVHSAIKIIHNINKIGSSIENVTLPYHQALLNFGIFDFRINVLCFNMEGTNKRNITLISSYFTDLNPKPDLFILQNTQEIQTEMEEILGIDKLTHNTCCESTIVYNRNLFQLLNELDFVFQADNQPSSTNSQSQPSSNQSQPSSNQSQPSSSQSQPSSSQGQPSSNQSQPSSSQSQLSSNQSQPSSNQSQPSSSQSQPSSSQSQTGNNDSQAAAGSNASQVNSNGGRIDSNDIITACIFKCLKIAGNPEIVVASFNNSTNNIDNAKRCFKLFCNFSSQYPILIAGGFNVELDTLKNDSNANCGFEVTQYDPTILRVLIQSQRKRNICRDFFAHKTSAHTIKLEDVHAETIIPCPGLVTGLKNYNIDYDKVRNLPDVIIEHDPIRAKLTIEPPPLEITRQPLSISSSSGASSTSSATSNTRSSQETTSPPNKTASKAN